MKYRFLIATVLAVILLSGCTPSPKAGDVQKDASASEVVDFGNGVYNFPYSGTDFDNALSAFIGSHPDLRLVSFAGYTDTQGYTKGYHVVFVGKGGS